MNSNNLVTRENDEKVKSFFAALDRLNRVMERLYALPGKKPALNGESFYTDRELSEKLKVSRRSLQDYRDQGRISYIKLGGKILYRTSDVERLLEKGYRKSLE